MHHAGPIPESLMNSTNIRSLVLSHNNLTGTIPGGRAWQHLSVLLLDNNNLEGQLPKPYSSTLSLTLFDVSYNMLNGTVSDELVQAASSLVYLSIQGMFTFMDTYLLALNNLQYREPADERSYKQFDYTLACSRLRKLRIK